MRLNEMVQMVDGYSVKRTRAEVTKEVTKELTEKHEKEKIKMVMNLIKMGLSNSQISEATDFTMTEDNIEKLRE